MDREAAEKSVQAVLERVGERLPQRTAFKAGCYYLAAGKKEKVLAAYQRENLLSPNALTWMFTAFTADSLGDAKSRDAAFKSIQKLPGDAGYKIIAKAVGEWLTKEEPPAEEAFRAISVQLSPVAKVDAEFYYGWYLQNRGFTGRALVHWKRCHEAPESSSIIRTQAETMLREHSTDDPKKPK